MESGCPSVVCLKEDASTENAPLGLLSVPNLDHLVMYEIARRGIAGEIFTNAGQEIEFRRKERCQRVFVVKGFHDRHYDRLRWQLNVR